MGSTSTTATKAQARFPLVPSVPPDTLSARQAERLAPWGDRVRWLSEWPDQMHGAVLGNEVLDAMPVQLLHWDGSRWWERGVVAGVANGPADAGLAWADRPTALRPPVGGPFVAGTETEIAALADPGDKDITAHVDFSAIALAAQEAGLEVLGYTSQARFLFNCVLLDLLQGADARTLSAAQKLVNEHEMGELFKVIGLARGVSLEPMGFAAGWARSAWVTCTTTSAFASAGASGSCRWPAPWSSRCWAWWWGCSSERGGQAAGAGSPPLM